MAMHSGSTSISSPSCSGSTSIDSSSSSGQTYLGPLQLTGSLVCLSHAPFFLQATDMPEPNAVLCQIHIHDPHTTGHMNTSHHICRFLFPCLEEELSSLVVRIVSSTRMGACRWISKEQLLALGQDICQKMALRDTKETVMSGNIQFCSFRFRCLQGQNVKPLWTPFLSGHPYGDSVFISFKGTALFFFIDLLLFFVHHHGRSGFTFQHLLGSIHIFRLRHPTSRAQGPQQFSGGHLLQTQ